VLAPAYDTQQQIYNGLLADLTTANTEINPAGIGFATGDLMYDGDMTKWRKFASSLRLRLAIHLSNVDATKAQAEAAAAVAAGVFTSNATTPRSCISRRRRTGTRFTTTRKAVTTMA